MPTTRHFVALDGLRGIAAITIVAGHACQAMPVIQGPPQGQLAVDFFFMLSGFVVAYAYEEKLRTTLSFSRFSIIRLVRLYPMVFFGVTIGAVSRILDGAAGHGILSVFAAAAFGFAFLPVPRNSPVPVSAFPLNGALWSLTYELISNIVYAWTIRWLSTRVVIVLTIAFSIALCVLLIKESGVHPAIAWGPGLVYGLVRVFAPFTIGVLIIRLGGAFRPRHHVRAMLAAFLLTATLWMPVHDSAAYDIVAILIVFPLILLVAAGSPDGGLLSNTWKILGMLSYPIYAINQPFFTICALAAKHAKLSSDLLHWYVAASFVACLITGWIVLKLYDEPLRRLLSRKLLKRSTSSPS